MPIEEMMLVLGFAPCRLARGSLRACRPFACQTFADVPQHWLIVIGTVIASLLASDPSLKMFVCPVNPWDGLSYSTQAEPAQPMETGNGNRDMRWCLQGPQAAARGLPRQPALPVLRTAACAEKTRHSSGQY